MPRLLSAGPVSGEDLQALPVATLGPAIDFYCRTLGFVLESQTATTATLTRDQVSLGVVTRADHIPGSAGSVAIEVDDLEGLHRELQLAGGSPGEFGFDEWNGQTHRTFFLVEKLNGYCFCFFTPVT